MFWLMRAIFFAFGGILVAGLLTYQHFHPAILERMCGQSGGCIAVQTSKYARIGPVPVAALGLAFYAVGLVGALLALAWPGGRVRTRVLAISIILGAIALLGSGVLMVVQFAVIRAFCALCTLSALLCLLWAASMWEAWKRPDWEAQPRGAVGLLVVFAAIVTVGWRSLGDGASSPGATVLARVNDKVITTLDLSREMPGELQQLEKEVYDARRRWLDEKIARVLIAKEAAARGEDAGEFLNAEVQRRIAPLLEQVRKSIDEAKKKDPNASLDLWRVEFLAEQDARQRAMEDLVSELKGRHRVEIMLKAPPAALQYDPSLAHVQGHVELAKVRLVLFSEFECPYCAELAQTLDKILDKYADASLTFLHMPMEFHPLSAKAAEAAECAAEQGRFWPFHDRLMKLGGQIEPRWEQYAQEAGLDVERFRTCLASGKMKERVERSRKAGAAMGIDGQAHGVPALYMNGRKIGGALTFEELSSLIETERRRAR